MKALFYFLFLIIFVACASKQKSSALDSIAKADKMMADTLDSTRISDSLRVIAAKKAFKPYKLNKYYTVVDTGYYGCGTLDGYYAIVERDGKVADTVHLGIGIQEVGKDHYMYLRLCKPNYQEDMYPGTLHVRPDQYITVLHGQEVPLTRLVKDFDLYKSVPNVINGKIYFSQYNSYKSGKYDVNAAEYDPKTGKVKSQFLITDKMDDEHASFWPHGEKGNIVFYGHNGLKWTFSPDFKLLNNVRHK